MPTCEELYIGLHAQCQEIMVETFKEDKDGIHAKSHNFLTDLSNWIVVIKARPEIDLLNSALREYHYGLLAVAQGQYRQGFMALRLFVEQALAAVHFSANELELRLWMLGRQDIYWQSILDIDKGIFSKSFVEAFCPELIEEATVYREMARTVYRECSEYTHGNFRTHHYLPEKLEFNKTVFEAWHDIAEAARIVISFAFCARYLPFLDKTMKATVEASVMEHLGHVNPIRAYYDGPKEGESGD